jgi:hypothetical protein
MRIDERVTPMAIDYLHLSGAQRGRVSLGIMDWVGDEVRVFMGNAGQPRPTDFDASRTKGTLSQWRRKRE